MNLAADAENARDVGAAFARFLEFLPEHFTEIAALVAELYAIRSALCDLDLLIISPEYGRRATFILDDLEIVQLSLELTLRDAHRLVDRLNHDGYRRSAMAHREVWMDVCRYFQQESLNTLQTRLDRFRQFIMDLSCTVRRLAPMLVTRRQTIDDYQKTP